MLLKILQFYLPAFIKKKKIRELFVLTAVAFQGEIPKLEGLSFRECLSLYALFTKEQAERYIRCGDDIEAVKNRLYQQAYQLGLGIKKSLHIVTPDEVITVSRIIYQILGIEFQGNLQGEILIKQCFFSTYYSGEVCQVISSLDEGMAAGLSGGGRLRFEQRITEGNSCCKAHLDFGRALQ